MNSNLVPDGHLFKLTFAAPSPGQRPRAHATRCTDSTHATTCSSRPGTDFDGPGHRAGRARACCPSIADAATVPRSTRRAPASRPGSPTNTRLQGRTYQPSLADQPAAARAIPDDITIVFDDAVRGHRRSALVPDPPAPGQVPGLRARRRRATVAARLPLPRPRTATATLSRADEYIDIVDLSAGAPTRSRSRPGASSSTRSGQAGAARSAAGARATSTSCELTQPVRRGRRLRLHAPRASASTRRAARAEFARPLRRAESVRRRGELRAGALRGLGPRRAADRVPRPAAGLHDPHLHRARGPGADAAATTAPTTGFVPWNLRTKDNLDVAPGLYIFHVDARDARRRASASSRSSSERGDRHEPTSAILRRRSLSALVAPAAGARRRARPARRSASSC